MFVDPCIIVKVIQKNPTRCTSVSTFIIPYLYDAQHVSGDTPPIIRSPKTVLAASGLHNAVEGCWTCGCWTLSGRDTLPDSIQQQHVQQPSTVLCKSEAASAVLGS